MEKIVAKIILEMLGAPKEHVDETMKLVVDKMSKDDKFKLLTNKVFPAEEINDKKLTGNKPVKFFSTFAEAELEFQQIEDLIGFCFDYMPSSVEVLHPDGVRLTLPNVNNILNDLLARLHQYDMVLKNIHAQNMLMKKELGKED